MAVIYIENKPYNVTEGPNLLETCLGLGFDIPYFCWHHSLGSVGACRQCAVKKYKDESDKRGRIVMSCMEPVVEGLRISIDDPEVREFRAGIIELLMTNHPHDCPVCDEGGECHLQDMTVLAGHSYRRFRFKKRTHFNQDLGPFINHEMNRCIQCYRCVRFYRDYAGGRDLDVFSANNRVYFGRHEAGTLLSEFSGNLAEVCPTGVFTDKPFMKHYTRKWDLRCSPSVCVHCGLGCNTTPGERYGMLRRIRNRYNGTVNGYFLCDRGRYGYEFVNSSRRILRIKKGQGVPTAEGTDYTSVIKYIKEITGNGHVMGIGSPRASLESNYMLRKLAGAHNFYSGMSDVEHGLASYAVRLMNESGAYIPSLRETEKADAVIILGEDINNTAPMLALSLRQTFKNSSLNIIQKNKISLWDDGAVRNAIKGQKAAFFVLTPYATRLDDIAFPAVHMSPEKITGLGFAIAEFLESGNITSGKISDEGKKLVPEIAVKLKSASRPLIVAGTCCYDKRMMTAAAAIAAGLAAAGRQPWLFLTVPECNTIGAALMSGGSLGSAFEAGRKQEADSVIILENDLYRRAGKKAVDSFLSSFKHVICIDCIGNQTTQKAEIVLPAAPFSESDGTLVNNEARAQRFYRVMEPGAEARPGWKWIAEIMKDERKDAGHIDTPDVILNSLASEISVFSELRKLSPPADYRIAGQKIPRESFRYSGRTAMNANTELHEGKPPEDNDSPLAFSMEGYRGQPPSGLIPFFWAPGWNSVQSVNKYQAGIGGSLRGGDQGLRLNISSSMPAPEAAIAPEYTPVSQKEFRVVPYYHVFGSEELSALSASVSERVQPPCIMMNQADGARIGITDGMDALLEVSGIQINMRVEINPEIPEGILGYPLGMPGADFIDIPGMGKIIRGHGSGK